MRPSPRTPWLFLTPHLLLFVTFILFPVCAVLVLSTFDWSLLGDHRFIGMANFNEILEDRNFWHALRNTLVYAAFVVPVTMMAGLGLALALNGPLPGRQIFRTLLYLPTVLSSVASATVAAWIFDDQYGVLNSLLASVHLPRLPWLSSTHLAMPALMAATLWLRVGLCMIVYLAALQEVPQSLLEAAQLDGANAWHRFRYVTWPLLRPTTIFLSVTTLIYSLHAFDLVYVMTNGGPAFSTTVLVQYLYDAAYLEQRQGYAAAISVLLLVLLIGLSSTVLLRWRATPSR